jgi:hypothetical protein
LTSSPHSKPNKDLFLPSSPHYNSTAHRYPLYQSRSSNPSISSTIPSHPHSKSHRTNNNSSQNRHLPPHPSISSLLHNPSTSSIRPGTRTRRRSSIWQPSHQTRRNETRSLRQLAVDRRLRLNARRERNTRWETDGFVGGVVTRRVIRRSRVKDFVDDVQDAVFDQNVGVDDTGGVDEDCAVGRDGDVEVAAVESGEFGVVG